VQITANILPPSVMAAIRNPEPLVWIDRYIAIVDVLLASHPDEDAYGPCKNEPKSDKRSRRLKLVTASH
jgi:cephalosporin hydroxylase